MRKLFWSCMTGGVLLVGGAISTAHFAAHHPSSVVARVLTGASYAASVVNPVGGLAPVVAHARTAAGEAAGEGVTADSLPDEPAPAPEQERTSSAALPPLPMGEELLGQPVPPGPVVVANTGSAAIVIREDDAPLASAGEPAGSFAPGAECPPAVCVAPRTMPFCHEQEECEELPMPRSAAEKLPMPIEEVEEVLPQPREEGAQTGVIDSGKEGMNETFTRYLDEPVAEMEGSKPESSCPAPAPRSNSCKPPCGPTCPSASPGHSEVSHKSALRKIRLFMTPPREDGALPHPEVDTMEYRPSDRRLYDYGPGSL